jgi:hypothetical protein
MTKGKAYSIMLAKGKKRRLLGGTSIFGTLNETKLFHKKFMETNPRFMKDLRKAGLKLKIKKIQ